MEKNRETSKVKGRLSWKVILAVSAVLMVYGASKGEMDKIYHNAMVICTSCIGLG